MKNFYRGSILLILMLFIMSGCNGNTLNTIKNSDETKVANVTMNPSFYVDPSIDFSTNQMTSIIIEFKTKPAVVAVKEAEAAGKQLTLEEATKQVEESHAKFQEEIKTLLEDQNVPYTIRHVYKTALNGVSMELPGKDIKRLSQSTVIARIYPNKKVHIMPPVTPFNQK
ncbi:protease inhibitor I9 family protein [Gottfriedia sp. NPDC058432]|uniref:protease inhibitor I9 family protein n=1 Tax=Gottfriedia sp. NPDC058432 TaxID=3346497 RepID=UPI00364A096B